MPTSDREMWCNECQGLRTCRFAPSPDAGPHWRCSECGETVPDVHQDHETELADLRAQLERVTAERDAARRELEKTAALLDEMAEEYRRPNRRDAHNIIGLLAAWMKRPEHAAGREAAERARRRE